MTSLKQTAVRLLERFAPPAAQRRIIEAYARVRGAGFSGSKEYWEDRYAAGGESGAGSVGPLARYKAEALNAFVAEHAITSVIEFGCGDGQQLELAEYPSYVGLDVSSSALRLAIGRHSNDSTKSFFRFDESTFVDAERRFASQLGLSLDVIYHLVEREVLDGYLDALFATADEFVVLYTSDSDHLAPDVPVAPHITHWPVRRIVADQYGSWELFREDPNPFPYRPSSPGDTSIAEFLFYRRRG